MAPRGIGAIGLEPDDRPGLAQCLVPRVRVGEKGERKRIDCGNRDARWRAARVSGLRHGVSSWGVFRGGYAAAERKRKLLDRDLRSIAPLSAKREGTAPSLRCHQLPAQSRRHSVRAISIFMISLVPP